MEREGRLRLVDFGSACYYSGQLTRYYACNTSYCGSSEVMYSLCTGSTVIVRCMYSSPEDLYSLCTGSTVVVRCMYSSPEDLYSL